MLKPGTVCQIRGVPQHALGGDCNGKIVVITGPLINNLTNFYEFTPTLTTNVPKVGEEVSAGHKKYLWPFEDFDFSPEGESVNKTLELTQ